MSKDSATVWWIEADTGELKSQPMGPNDVLGSGTFENEVVIKYARNPVDLTTIYHRRAGNDWERDALVRLRTKSQEMRRALEVQRAAEAP